MKKRNYPHISDTNFPDLNSVDAYKYKQEFDYSRYEISTTAHLCSVPWRSSYADTVYFETEEKRDEYFNGIFEDSGVTLPTMFRLYDSGSLKIEVPIDVAQKYNYLVIDYGIVTKEGEPVLGELPDGFRRMCYFVEDMTQESVNTTRLVLALDYWQTYVYSVDIEYLELVRGHAPLAATNVADYLANPLANSELLLSPDVNFGELQNVKSENHIVLNDSNMLLCIATTGNTGTTDHPWDWVDKTNTEIFYNSQTLSNVQVISTPVENWQAFADYTETAYPQFFQTVKAIFLIPEKLIEYAGPEFDFMGVNFRFLKDQSNFKAGDFNITREKFGFDDRFADLAKLYTYPYSAIVADDFRGNSTIIKIEETVGRLELRGVINYTFPFLNIQGYHTGLGSDVTSVISFKNSIDNTYTIGGRDYDFSVKWNIPTMALQLTAEADWVLNGKISADTAKANAYASAATAKANADSSALTGKTNSDASALTGKTNTEASTNTGAENARESALTGKNNTARSVDASTEITNKGNELAKKMYEWGARENAFSYGQSSIMQNQQAQAAFDNGWTQMIAGLTGSSVTSPSLSNVLGNVAAALPGFVNNALTFSQVTSTDRVLINTSQTVNAQVMQLLYGVKPDINIDGMFIDQIANYTPTMSGLKGVETQASMNNATDISNISGNTTNSNAADSYNTTIANTNRSAATSLENNQRSYDTTIANNQRSYDTTIANNQRSYDTTIANTDRSWDASHNQKLLSSHPEFGARGGDGDLCVKPMGIRYNVLTQSAAAIRQAGEQFLRFGYALAMQWKFTTFNVMPHFSYWEASQIVVRGQVYAGALDVIKGVLISGVTVWRNPSELGTISIYDNKE